MKISKLITIIMMLTVTLCLCACDTDAPAPEPTTVTKADLTFNEDGEYTILHICDLHETLRIFGQHVDEGRRLRDTLDENNVNFINAALDAAQPDLVVLGGDNVFCLSLWGAALDKEVSGAYVELCKLFDSRKQAWTLVFGNHDDEGSDTKTALLECAMENSAYFVGGFEDGDLFYAFEDKKKDMVGNYAIPLYDRSGANVYNLFLFDSGSESKFEKDKYNYIRPSQVDWYAGVSASLKEAAGATVPAVAFTHIPLFEHKEAYENRYDTTKVASWAGEYGGYALSDTRSILYARACEIGDIRGIFTGHNHGTSATMVAYKEGGGKIMLSTTRQCSRLDEGDGAIGTQYARVIKLTASGGLSTYEYSLDNAEFNLVINH